MAGGEIFCDELKLLIDDDFLELEITRRMICS